MATVEINVASDSQKCKTYHFPCSYAQQRLWFMDQLEPGSPAYNISLALDFHGPLNVGALTSSLREIVRRHEALRTVFANIGGSPIQVVRENVEVPVPEIDLSSRDEREREAYRRELEQSESQQRFDLSTGPLLRMKLLRFHGSEHTLLLTFHHSVSDGWSMGVMVKELRALYEAFSESLPSPLEELPIQYPDYTLWQRESLAAGPLEEQLEYWKKQLDGLEPLEISGKSEVRGAIGPEALVEEVSFSTDLTSRLEQLSQQCNTTLFMTVLAAFQIVLARYTGQNDIAVGTPIAGRNASELEHLIGFFVNTLVLRTDLGGNPSVTELLERTRATAIQAYAHQDYPFELLVEQLQPERIIHSTPLFQVLFVLQNMPLEKIGLPGLKVNVRPINSRIAKFDLSLSLWEVEGQLRGQLEYKSGLYTPPRARLLIKHLEKVMQAMVGDPAYRVHEIDCLTPGEKRQLLQEGNSTQDEDADHRSLHELFERHVRLKPDAPAIIHGSRTLTFIELNERANQLANFLRSKGVGTETQVALCLNRDPDMMVAVLGVLKAGAAYVPLDITHPEERLRYTLENSQAKLLLTKAPLLKCLPQQTTSIVCLDRDWVQIAHYTKENPNTVVFPDSLAYVIYTSGSTGKPKGVAMVHRAVTNLIQWQLSHRQAEQPRRTLQFTSLTFDVSFQEMFATWCMGGTLVLVEDELRRDPQQLWDFLRAASIERLFLPFVALQQLAEILPATSRLDQISLREVITAGEQLKITPGIQKLFSMCSACTLDNQYGPTESHVVTAELLQGPALHWPSLPSIGKPITNTQVYIFNQEMTLVPSNVPGELYIGGAALARGYLGKPDLTAERFVPDPLCTTAGSRLYRTGDIARWVNGEIEFLGRSDHQVKVRGYRVEPGEIEAVLADHAAVAQAVVVLQEIAEEQKRLVGYVTLKGGQDGTSSRELRKYVQERLPEYMVPGVYVELEEMPLTASGKIDRKRLPVPKSLGAGDQKKYVGPRDEIEGIVSGIWEQVLKVKRVGVEENFFELGGHSLLATQVISRVREAFGVELP
ncbi:MAG TPA: amino acid adenylation domain-containing protein, partial [Candidatus Angelobacter sp.]|nr:amino acid adenylation domain-containing protein [Candidatus Angelobacter sp.]